MKLNIADTVALNRVFHTTNLSFITKGQLIRANTAHLEFIDYLQIELYSLKPKHAIFDNFTDEQHSAMAKILTKRAEESLDEDE